MFLWWGRELIQFYNDGYRLILGSKKHPAAMGQAGRECWKEIWEILEPMIEKVFAGGATYVRDGLLVLDRHGFMEECYFNYGQSPIRDEGRCRGHPRRVLREHRVHPRTATVADPRGAGGEGG